MNSHDRSKGAEPGFVVRCRTSGEGHWVEERRQDLCRIPPSCHALWRSQLTTATLTLFDRRGLTNGRQETGTPDAVTCFFLFLSQDPEDALWCGELTRLNYIYEHMLDRCFNF